jgi:hypothetical protein
LLGPKVIHVTVAKVLKERHPFTLAGTSITIDAVRMSARLTGAALAALSALHVAWGLGSSFPFRSRDDLADAVVGSPVVPAPLDCFGVAGALAVAAALVANVIPLPRPLRRSLLIGVAGVLGVRSALGFLGKTALVSPGSDSERFVRLDHLYYAPLCLGLSLGALASATRVPAQR